MKPLVSLCLRWKQKLDKHFIAIDLFDYLVFLYDLFIDYGELRLNWESQTFYK